ncbi:MAG: hypothetical protein IPL91_01945 [Hyphomicrobium sp.]|nr:hypothetical protein [Hyphomicrobium sp.]
MVGGVEDKIRVAQDFPMQSDHGGRIDGKSADSVSNAVNAGKLQLFRQRPEHHAIKYNRISIIKTRIRQAVGNARQGEIGPMPKCRGRSQQWRIMMRQVRQRRQLAQVGCSGRL